MQQPFSRVSSSLNRSSPYQVQVQPVRLEEVRQVRPLQVHAQPGARGQRQVQPHAAVLGRGQLLHHPRPRQRALLRQGARRESHRGE